MLSLRNATIADASLLFAWRNDPITRLNSHNPAALVFESHVAWLRAILADPARQVFIAEEGGRPVGTVRVDREADDSAELSWTVAPEARGRGIAKYMVRLVADRVSQTCSLRAEVKAGNAASIKVAEAAGMRMSRREGEVMHFLRPVSTRED
jgi:RimJ/RimL family protein N-acetyltransferase